GSRRRRPPSRAPGSPVPAGARRRGAPSGRCPRAPRRARRRSTTAAAAAARAAAAPVRWSPRRSRSPSSHGSRKVSVRYSREACPVTDQTYNQLLRDQIDWHWTHQLRKRLDGLTDEEYFWEPVPGCWSVRPRGTGTAPVQVGAGEMTIDFAFPQPTPAPFTTIAWRLGHVIVGVLAMRNASHFGRAATDYQSFEYAPTAHAA